jgi:hypothetical protein
MTKGTQDFTPDPRNDAPAEETAFHFSSIRVPQKRHAAHWIALPLGGVIFLLSQSLYSLFIAGALWFALRFSPKRVALAAGNCGITIDPSGKPYGIRWEQIQSLKLRHEDGKPSEQGLLIEGVDQSFAVRCAGFDTDSPEWDEFCSLAESCGRAVAKG